MSSPAHRKQLDALARSQGYRDYATFQAYYNNYQRVGTSKAAAPTPTNIFQKLMIHPANMFRHISEKINKATGY